MTLVEDQDSNYWLLFPPELSMPVAGDNVEIVESFTYPCVDIRNTASSQHDIRKRIAIACNCMASLDIWHSSIALRTKLQLVSLHPSCHSLWSRNMVPYLTTREESGCVWPMVSVCGIYYEFPGRRTFLMKRSTDVLTSHHSHTSSRSSLVTLHMPIHLCTTVEPLGPVWPLCQVTEPLIGPTASHLAPHCWIRFGTIQHWSGNRLLSSAESSSLEHAHRNGNVQHWRSNTMMMMMMMFS